MPDQFDVLVVGSGASGGWACKRLAEAGLKVALVDAGRPQSDRNFTDHVPAFKLKYRNLAPEVIRRAGRPMQMGSIAGEYNYDWACNDLDEPYTTSPGMPFTWRGRMRITGGRTNVWGRHSYRFSDLDFKAASRDGYGADWPLRYKDLAPYYDIVEEYVGISGSAEGVYELPDGKFQPPMAMTRVEEVFRDRVKAQAGPHHDHGPHGQRHRADQWPGPLPLLPAVLERLHDPLRLQLLFHHGRGRHQIRPLHAGAQRHGVQGAARPGTQPGHGFAVH